MKWFDKTADGLTEDELRAVEEAFGFAFPPDLRALLAEALPIGDGWPDWRQPHAHELIEWFDTPAAAIEELVDDGFWRESWGERPEDDDDAVEEARRLVSLAPILIPLFGNVFLPSRPVERGNPLFAFEEDGVIVAASDLDAFSRGERGGNQPRHIDFWSELARPE
jgi:hypothetical protein